MKFALHICEANISQRSYFTWALPNFTRCRRISLKKAHLRCRCAFFWRRHPSRNFAQARRFARSSPGKRACRSPSDECGPDSATPMARGAWYASCVARPKRCLLENTIKQLINSFPINAIFCSPESNGISIIVFMFFGVLHILGTNKFFRYSAILFRM